VTTSRWKSAENAIIPPQHGAEGWNDDFGFLGSAAVYDLVVGAARRELASTWASPGIPYPEDAVQVTRASPGIRKSSTAIPRSAGSTPRLADITASRLNNACGRTTRAFLRKGLEAIKGATRT
jgi:hypothetical protein